jgi:hypothetical protein
MTGTPRECGFAGSRWRMGLWQDASSVTFLSYRRATKTPKQDTIQQFKGRSVFLVCASKEESLLFLEISP